MTNEELVEQIQNGIDVQKNLTILYEQNKRFIYTMCKPFMNVVEADDLLQEGYIGFQEAVFAFDSKLGVKLLTFAFYKIRNNCIQYIENSSSIKRIPSNLRQQILKYKKYLQQCEGQPDDKDVMKELGISQAILNRIRKTIYEQNCISISSITPGTDNLTYEDTIADETDLEQEVLDDLLTNQERKILEDAIQDLNSNEQKVISERYWNEQTQCQCAEQMNLSTSRIGQIEKKALSKLRKINSLQKLHDEVYGYDSNYAYHMGLKKCLDNNTSCVEYLALKRVEYDEKRKSIQSDIDDFFTELMEGQVIDMR